MKIDPDFAFICDRKASVTVPLKGLALFPEDSFLELLVPSSREPVLQGLASLEAVAAALPAEWVDGRESLVTAAAAGDQILLIGSPSRLNLVAIAREVSPGSGELKAAAAQIVALHLIDDGNADLWNEISKLNNELTTSHRNLTKSNAQLKWLNEEKNNLLGMAAHDLRSPLGVILGYADAVACEPDRLSEDQLHMLSRIRYNAGFMAAVIDDVLDLSAIESGTVRLDIELFDLPTLLQEALELTEPLAARKDLKIRLDDSAPLLPRVGCDRRKLLQVLQNLLSNAIKFSPSGADPIVVEYGQEKDHFWIRVADLGIGIQPEELYRLFTPFSRLSGRPTGGEKSTGLGLAISRRMVEAHGGSVSVDSEPGRGTAICVELPMWQDRKGGE